MWKEAAMTYFKLHSNIFTVKQKTATWKLS